MYNRAMKKLSRRILTVIMIFMLAASSGCAASRPVNDSDTGMVEVSPPRYTYADGTYHAYGTHYSAEGFVPVMSIRVQNGIVSSVKYDLYDIYDDPLSEYTDEESLPEAEELKLSVKNLSAQLMQSQSAGGLHYSSKYTDAFILLAKKCLELASSGEESSSGVAMEQSYTAAHLDDDTGITSHLEVTFLGDLVRSISFWQTGEDGLRLSDYFDSSSHPDDFSVTYQQLISYLNRTYEDMDEIKKDNPYDCPLIEFDIYNSLASRVKKMHKSYED